ncbi:MAG: lysine--tRNA ligase [Rhodobacteraceae bacterium]|nr:lysine--tRNA ligase [Paracoccaceae bacterium]
MSEMMNAALQSSAWPFHEARELLRRIRNTSRDESDIAFQTGFGPSGLPHIGTFGEVARTEMVRRAFAEISDLPTRLICFSDDMDGMRKVPGNIPNPSLLRQDLHLPLCQVRDPFGSSTSFAAHNNDRLREFLHRFGFECEFLTASECYRSGRFDEVLLRVLERFEKVMEIVLPTLGGIAEGRQASYSPFLPISPKTGRVLQVPTLERRPSKGTIIYEEPDGERMEIPVTGGNVKLQWKADWAARWWALGVDYEMYGKDLAPSAQLAAKICRALGSSPPIGMVFELFLDEQGRKISKSGSGGGVSMEDWLSWAPPECLSAFVYRKPGTAKRLFPGVVPATVDEYHRHLSAYPGQDCAGRLNNPVWHIHGGDPPHSTMAVSYSMLVNLISTLPTADERDLWGFIKKYAPDASPDANPDLADCVSCALRYFRDHGAGSRQFRAPTETERTAMAELRERLTGWTGGNDSEEFQSLVCAVGKAHGFGQLRDWFKALYEVLLGASHGPRFGSLIALFGARKTADLINQRLSETAGPGAGPG